MMVHHNDQAIGTLGGTFIAFIGIIDSSDVLKTSVLAGIGAVVSYTVSRMMQHWFGKRSHDKK